MLARIISKTKPQSLMCHILLHIVFPFQIVKAGCAEKLTPD